MSQFLEAVTWVESLKKFGIRPGLGRMEWVLERFGNPERRLKFVHIAGTNGKGSTLHYIASVLRSAGLSIGTYISPAMGGITNRIQFNGIDIPEDEFAQIVKQIQSLTTELEETDYGSLTEFEVTTIVAILYFSQVAYPDLVIWETGLGGRLDCTNVVFPLISVITNVGYDHTNILGEHIEQIAWEKAGIIKNGVPTVTAAEIPGALSVIREAAISRKATLYELQKDFKFARTTSFDPREIDQKEIFEFYGPYRDYTGIEIPLIGEHQVKNAALAIMVLEVLRQNYAVYFDERELREGLKRVDWPGRFEIIQKDPHLILDGAHNIEGMRAFIQTFYERFPTKKIKLLFSALADKDVQGMIDLIAPLCHGVVVTKLDHERAASPTDMEIWFRDYLENIVVIPDPKQALEEWLNNSGEDLLVATGSLYFISDIRKVLGKALGSCSDLS